MLDHEMLILTLQMFLAHGLVTIPAAIAAGYMGWRAPTRADTFVLLGLGMLLFAVMPNMPGSASGSAGIVYMALPYLVPIFIVLPYAAGMLVRTIVR